MDFIDLGWKFLHGMPPIISWKLLHGIPHAILNAPLRLGKRPQLPVIKTDFLGYTLNSPIGIAAGIDKDASLARVAWLSGAGFHVVGSVLPHKFKGVDPKILLRLEEKGTVNRLGLPSPGFTQVLKRIYSIDTPGMPIAVSIAALTFKGFGDVYREVKHMASWIELNISCPNVEAHGTFEDPDFIPNICTYMKPIDKPVLLKIPRTLNTKMIKRYVDASLECGFSGIVAANTLKVRIRGYNAGYGGPLLFKSTIQMIRIIRSYAPEDFKIVASGGIDSGAKALIALNEGASLVEILSALINRGPRALSDIIWGLYRALVKRHAQASIKQPRIEINEPASQRL